MSSSAPPISGANDPSTLPGGERPGLLRSSSSYSLGTISTLVGALVRAKVAAVVLGAAGVGLVAQLNNLSSVLGVVTTVGLSNAGVKLIAEARGKQDDDQLNRVITFLFVVPLLFGALVVVGGLLAAPALAGVALNDAKDGEYVAIAVLSVPLNLLIASWYVVLQGAGLFTRLAVVTAMTAFLNTVCVIALLLAFQLSGAVAGIIGTSVLGLIVVAMRERWVALRLSLRRANPGRRAIAQFLRLGGASVLVGTTSLAVDTFLRTWLVRTHGLAANGLYQPTAMMAAQLFLPLVGGIAAYLFPTLTTDLVSNATNIRRSVTQAFRLAILVSVTTATVVLVFRKPILVVVFSSGFLAGASPMALQLPGVVLQAATYIAATSLLPMERVRAWASIAIGTLAVQTLAGIGLIDHLGAQGISVAFDCAWLFSLCATVIVLRRLPNVRPDASAWRLFATGFCMVSAAAVATIYIPSPYPEIGDACAFSVWVLVGLRAEDRQRARSIMVGAARRVPMIGSRMEG